MSMALKVIPYQYQVPVTGAAGAGVGLVTTELLSEYTTRLLGWTSYLKAATKSAVKIGVGGVVLSASNRSRTSPNEKVFGQAFAFATFGSILLDWIAAWMPGGIVGVANRLAISTRVALMGTKTVAKTLSQYETPPVSTPPQFSAPTQLGRY